jgi:hypothetical protein
LGSTIDGTMLCRIFPTCDVQITPSSVPPAGCPTCQDERQFVGRSVQRWTTLVEMPGRHRNQLLELEPGLLHLQTHPSCGIGQHALLVRAPGGNLVWECVSFLDRETEATLRDLGGLAAMAIGKPRFYAGCVAGSEACSGVPIYLRARDREHLLRPSSAVVHFEGNEVEPPAGLRLLRLGGHIPGSAVLHGAAGAGGRGTRLTGDTVLQNARTAVLRSAERHLGLLDGSWLRG